MSLRNDVRLIGRLTKDPTMRGTACVYTIAVSRPYKPKREGEKSADFFECVTFSSRAEVAMKYFKKGMLVAAEGELRNQEPYKNKEGVTVYPDNAIYIAEQTILESKRNSEEDDSPY